MNTRYNSGHWNATKQNRTLTSHHHTGLELTLVLNGSASWNIDGRQVHTPARHLSFTWPWQVHSAWGNTLSTVEIYWLTLPVKHTPECIENPLEFAPELGLRPEENRILMQRFKQLSPTPVIKGSSLICQKFPVLVERLRKSKGLLDFTSRTIILSILSEILQSSSRTTKPSDNSRQRVKRFLQELEADPSAEWSLEEMSDHCELGRTHFNRWMRELTGETAMRHLARLRTQRAQALLQHTDQPITDIAFNCGFQTSQYFATVFRSFTGQSPQDYRRQKKAAQTRAIE
jgi:AraC family L-rhamnose operon regulatory protein RhaS